MGQFNVAIKVFKLALAWSSELTHKELKHPQESAFASRIQPATRIGRTRTIGTGGVNFHIVTSAIVNH